MVSKKPQKPKKVVSKAQKPSKTAKTYDSWRTTFVYALRLPSSVKDVQLTRNERKKLHTLVVNFMEKAR
jgi:hypothetical protein